MSFSKTLFVILCSGFLIWSGHGARADAQPLEKNNPQPASRAQKDPGKGTVPGPGLASPSLPGAADTKARPENQKEIETGPFPRVVIPTTAFDAGIVKSGQKVTHDFWVRNDGEGELIIKKVSPG